MSDITLTATGLLWQAVGKPMHPDAVANERSCAVCGRPGSDLPSVSADEFFPDTFNDREILSSGTGRVCVACVAYYQRAGRGKTLRSSHLIVTASHVEEAKTDRMLALCVGHDVPDPPFAVTVALSYKKHLLPRARVALYRERFPVSLELEQGECQPESLGALVLWISRLRFVGFYSDDIETWRPPTHRLYPYLALWREATKAIGPLRGSFTFRLACRLVTAPPKSSEMDVNAKPKRRSRCPKKS